MANLKIQENEVPTPFFMLELGFKRPTITKDELVKMLKLLNQFEDEIHRLLLDL